MLGNIFQNREMQTKDSELGDKYIKGKNLIKNPECIRTIEAPNQNIENNAADAQKTETNQIPKNSLAEFIANREADHFMVFGTYSLDMELMVVMVSSKSRLISCR